MNLNTSFNILGLSPEANEAQAKHAYKAQVRRWHPDQFPEGSTAKAGAEEQLKQINIAYAQVKARLAQQRPAPSVTENAPSNHPHQSTARHYAATGATTRKRAWVDHLLDALNALAGNRSGDPPPPPAGKSDANRRKTFEQVLDEMAGGKISPKKNRPSSSSAAVHRTTAGYRRYRHSGRAVGAVGTAENKGPVKPVGRVRGIGRNR